MNRLNWYAVGAFKGLLATIGVFSLLGILIILATLIAQNPIDFLSMIVLVVSFICCNRVLERI